MTIISSASSRISGLASGMDVDSIVEELMEAEEIPLEKLYQKQDLAEWKQDAYREVITSLSAFEDEYFDVLSDNCMLSSNTYQSYAAVVSDNTVVSISSNSEAETGSHTITVNNLATKATYKSASTVTKGIEASSAADFTSANGKSFTITVDDIEKTITIDDDITDINSLQDAIDSAIGSGKVEVSDTNGDGTGYLTFSIVDDSGCSKLTLSNEDDDEDVLSDLGFADGDNTSNRLSTGDTLEEIAAKTNNTFEFDGDGYVVLTINDVEFEFDESTTLGDMISEINDSDAGVKMKYDNINDKIVFTAEDTGAGENIVISEEGSTFLTGFDITEYTEGEDAEVILDDQKITRSSNSFTIDGVTYKLLSESTEEQTVSLSLDTDGIYEKIEAFVNDYNSLIDTLNDKINEDYDSDYPPLTKDEKEDMTDDEIESWEEIAKIGLLEDDSTIKNLLSNMRTALYESVDGVSINLASIGITTSSDFTEYGKLQIDEDILKDAIENDTDKVMNLFSKNSQSYSGRYTVRTLDNDERKVRYKEEGLAYRISDILQDNISTYRNSAGFKGTLLEKAGMEGDASEDDNFLTDEIEDYDDQIEEMLDELEDKEEFYYDKFTTMETYISEMNSNINALLSALG